jgi:hypothetical protein
MPIAYIQRSLEPVLKRAAKEFPVVIHAGDVRLGPDATAMPLADF